MISDLLYFLLLEPLKPSHFTLAHVFPQSVIATILQNGAQPLRNVAQASVLTLESPLEPQKKTESLGPVIAAKSFFSIDIASGKPLLMQDIFSRRSIASISKLMTAMVILDTHSPEEKFTASANAPSQEGSSMGLTAGEVITVGNALTGMLINSGNDAAVALAEYDAATEEAFVAKMNAKATGLGLNNTRFSNAKGFDDTNNYSTAFDTITFARAALNYPLIRTIIQTSEAQVASVDGRIQHKLKSTNDMLTDSYFPLKGMKTGTTPLSGESFVSLFVTESGNEILTVILDSPDRFKETRILLDWVSRNFTFPPKK